MKGLMILEPGRTEVCDVERPVLEEGQVLLKVGKVGFCGGDLNAFRGTFSLQEYPVVLGHEVGAVIVEVASEVPDTLRVGMKVTVMPYQSCQRCYSCRHGRPNACQDNRTMGVRRPGAMTEYVAVRWQDIYKSERLSLQELALVEPLTVGFHAVERGRITSEDTVAVIGCGIVGMGAVAAGAQRGARVIAVDIDDDKIALARQAGAAEGFNSTRTDLHQGLSRLTHGYGPEVIIEAVGNPTTFRAAVEEVAYTGRVVYIGYAKTPVEYNSALFVQKELEIYGSRNSVDDFGNVISMLEGGSFPSEHVISEVVPLEKAGDALARWSKEPGRFTKIMVDLDNE